MSNLSNLKNNWDNFWRQSKEVPVSWSKQRMMTTIRPYLKSGKRALDAGCGSGFFSAFFCDHDLDTTAVDYSESALNLTKQRTLSRAKIIQADMLAENLLQILNAKFDIIFSDGLFEHFKVEEQDRIMTNFKNILNDSGVIITFVPNLFSPWTLIRPFIMPGIEEKPFHRQELIDLNMRNGLSIVRSGPFSRRPTKRMSR